MATGIKDLIRDFAYKDVVEDILQEGMTSEQIAEAEEKLDSLMETIKTYLD